MCKNLVTHFIKKILYTSQKSYTLLNDPIHKLKNQLEFGTSNLDERLFLIVREHGDIFLE